MKSQVFQKKGVLSGLVLALTLFAFTSVTVGQTNGDILISGVVSDQNNVSIPGVNVFVKGTQNGTITDVNGKYSLEAPGDGILVFSFVGFETFEMPINQRSVLDIMMTESVETLNEVVVIGYGTTTTKELTGAVTSVKSEEFNKGTFSDPMGLVQGKVAGLSITKPNGADPLADYQILLRGVNTLTSGQGPLIIIDGVVGADMKNINFENVESIDVLKDGSAAAIYGTRGTNGVIIITSKGIKKGKGTIDYSVQTTAQVAPKYVRNLSATEFEDAILTYQPSKTSSLFGSSTDWFDEITRDMPLGYQQNIALSGGNDNISHRTSLTHSFNQGLMNRNDSERLLIKTDIKQNAFNEKLVLNLNMINSIRKYSPANYSLFNQAFIQNPTQPVYDDLDPDTGGYSYKQGLGYFNPVAMINERTRDGKSNDLILNLRAVVNITDNLSWDNFISSQISEWEDNSYKTRYYPSIIGIDGEAEISNGRSTNTQFESLIKYSGDIDRHSFQSILGYSYQGFEDAGSYMGNANFDTDYFLYNNMAGGSFLRDGKAWLGSYRSSSKLIALFGRVMYNFDEKYLFSASLRREGSSKFGENNKWGWFPALSVGWRLNEESFMSNIQWLDNLKLRVGYGVTGNQSFAPYNSLILLERVGSLYYNEEWINSYGLGQNPNPDLRWEKKKELNLGVDFGIYNSKLTGSLEFYLRKTDDLLWDFQVSVPPYLYPYLFTNVGTISNRGVELTINALLVNKEDFKWVSTLTASHNKNYLDKISNDIFTQESYETAFIGGTIGVFSQRIQEGEELGTFYGPIWLGLDEFGNDVFKNQNPVGEVDKSKWEKIGTANPIAALGWSNAISYKQWTLNFAFRAGIGGKVLNTYRLYYESWNNIGLRNIVHTQYETPEFSGNITYSSKYIEDASFLKLDNVTLNYDFNIASNSISRLSLFGSAQNVFWITGYKGIDPEVNLGGLEPGIDGLSYYPRTTSLTLGLNATF
jgi:TonB-linked SusC/RagA family outer membrane protein